MTTKKPYEMNFAEFAEAISPSKDNWGVTIPLKRSLDSAEWLANVWRTSDGRITYRVSWKNHVLKNELPPEAQKYEFDDLLLHPTTARLGLNPATSKDNHKSAELLAMRNAWIASIQNRYGQSAKDAACCTLTRSASVEYVLLTSDWVQHPWIQRHLHQYIAEQNLKKLEQDRKPAVPVEMSDDPKWPNAQVIHARATAAKLTPHEQAEKEEDLQNLIASLKQSGINDVLYVSGADENSGEAEEKKRDIRYWLDKFRVEEGKWTSEFDMRAYDAEGDIDIARLKIAALQKIIERQMALITDSERIIRKNRRLEAALLPSKKIGRPEKLTERQEIALRFASQWVQSLMDALGIKSCAQLESFIGGSSQRNWLRWLKCEGVLTRKSLSKLLTAEIRQGSYKGKPLHDVLTTPEHNDLLALISMT